ncbi:hypothetical protein SAMN04487779_104115 [Belnapia rosea]|uniref:Uncharacterized protein n=1 Tax=Belnapia rosea TaxID=938405 RepID=A0A1G7DA59_9PROT|nr:hypothetical protein SAMN04487779_104115 [Belnapia rosea]
MCPLCQRGRRGTPASHGLRQGAMARPTPPPRPARARGSARLPRLLPGHWRRARTASATPMAGSCWSALTAARPWWRRTSSPRWPRPGCCPHCRRSRRQTPPAWAAHLPGPSLPSHHGALGAGAAAGSPRGAGAGGTRLIGWVGAAGPAIRPMGCPRRPLWSCEPDPPQAECGQGLGPVVGGNTWSTIGPGRWRQPCSRAAKPKKRYFPAAMWKAMQRVLRASMTTSRHNSTDDPAAGVASRGTRTP